MLARLSLWLVALSLTGGMAAQEPREYRVVSEVRLVVLDAAVRDERGQPVGGLGREAFRVFDSHREQPLAAFAAEDAPVTAGIVLDASGSMRARRASAVLAATAFLEHCNPGDETFLVTFNDTAVARPPAAAPQLRREIESAALAGRTALYDGVALALRQAGAGRHERKVLVVISDGADNASTLDREAILHQAQSALATIYTVGIHDPSGDESDDAFLRRLARLTGGEAHIDTPDASLPAVCAAIARDIRARYTLAFHAAPAQKIETRPLRVEASAAGRGRLRVLARPSYRIAPSPESTP